MKSSETHMIQTLVFQSALLASDRAAYDISQWVDQQNILHSIVLATGRSPIAMYAKLVDLYKNHPQRFHQSIFFNLDEYIGYAPSNMHSFAFFLQQHLIDPLGIDQNNVHFWNGVHPKPKQAVKAHQSLVEQSGLDLVILGLGQNGHIAFNEPDSAFNQTCHVVKLSQQTLTANKDMLDPSLPFPQQAYTMGIQTILSAKKIIVLAFGENKAKVVEAILKQPQTEKCPATALQTHPNCTLYLDKTAAQLI